jgi:hypothetical protein
MQEKIRATRAPIRKLKELASMTEKHEVTHREIFDRLIAVEQKVDKIETNTGDMVAAFNAAQGAFMVLEWLAKAAKPILWLVALGTAVVALFDHWKHK